MYPANEDTVVYILDMNDRPTDEQMKKILSLLPDERIRRSERYRFEKDRLACLTSFLLLLYGLSDKGITEFPQILKNRYGKPFFAESSLHFNISHCSKAVCCAVSGNNIGADIQDTVTDFESIIGVVMSEREQNLIRSSDDPCITFTKLWSLKESYVKYLGTGLGNNMAETEFLCGDDSFTVHGCRFTVKAFDCCQVSVCTEKEDPVFIKKTLSEYLDSFTGTSL